MAGRVVVSTLNNDTGVLATQNGMTGIAKAWINYNGSTGTINGSFNVGSVTKNGTGDYTLNFTTAMPNANYCPVLGQITFTSSNFSTKLSILAGSTFTTPILKTTTQLRIAYTDNASTYYDSVETNVAILSS